jgi:pyruvate dehydrogenase E1 component alpha subunit
MSSPSPPEPPPDWLTHHWGTRPDPAPLLPAAVPLRVLGTPAQQDLDPELLRTLHRRLVVGRRFNQQADALAKQGRLAIYPPSTGQEACQVAAAQVLAEDDWLFPSYRDTLAVFARGIDPVEALTLLRGNAHSGYDPRAHRTAPLCTPLANQLPHALGLARAAQLAGDPVCALALVGDGGTSEGDFHEALTFAGVLAAPLVVLVQNNGYAISVPLVKQSAAPSFAVKAAGYGVPGVLVDGNDVAAVYTVLRDALERARRGEGPTLVEALTYRLDPHTNTDDESRYRSAEEVAAWRAHDPLPLAEQALRAAGILDEAGLEAARMEAEAMAGNLRERLNQDPELDPMALFAHVYAEPTQQLRAQREQLRAELAAEHEPAGHEPAEPAGHATTQHEGAPR